MRLLTVGIEYGAFERQRDIARQQGISPEELAEAWLMDTLERVPTKDDEPFSLGDANRSRQ